MVIRFLVEMLRLDPSQLREMSGVRALRGPRSICCHGDQCLNSMPKYPGLDA